MDYDAEARIAAEIGKFLMNGGLFRGSETGFVVRGREDRASRGRSGVHGAQVDDALRPLPPLQRRPTLPSRVQGIIWTTTPWTIPGNRGIAFSAEANYGIYEVTAVAEGSNARVGERLVLADELSETVQDVAQIEAWTRTGDAGGLDGTICAHPLRGKGYEFDVRFSPATSSQWNKAQAWFISVQVMARTAISP